MNNTMHEATIKQTSNTVWPANGCHGYSANKSQIVRTIIKQAMTVLKISLCATEAISISSVGVPANNLAALGRMACKVNIPCGPRAGKLRKIRISLG